MLAFVGELLELKVPTVVDDTVCAGEMSLTTPTIAVPPAVAQTL